MDGGYLYDKMRMSYEEDYELDPVLTQGMEDAISIISNLSHPCLNYELHYPKQPCLITNGTFPLDSSLFKI